MSRLDDILAGRAALLDEAPATLASDLSRVIERLGASLDELLAKYDRTGGRFTASVDSIRQAAGSLPELVRALDDAGYSVAADRYADRYADVVAKVKETFGVKGIRAEFSAVSLEGLETARTLDLQMFEQIGTNAMREVQRSISQAVIYERDYTRFVESLREAITGNDKRGAPLATRATAYAETAIGIFDRTVTKELGDEAGITMYRYWGPLDRITRPWCRARLNHNQPMTVAEIDALPRSPSNTTGESNFLAAGGWKCRHGFFPIASDELPENQ